MYKIDNILLDEQILNAKFQCDLKECKGACCTFPGDKGAPLLEEEVEQIEKSVEAAKEYLSPRSIKIIERDGFFEKENNSLTTTCINRRDCVFVYYEGDVAKCALEKAYFDGKSKFRKPLSCHLFPLRIGNFGGYYIYYEKISECSPGRKLGDKEDIQLVDTLKDAIIRAFGKDFYDDLKQKVELHQLSR